MVIDNRAEVRKVLLITLLLNLFVMGLKAAVGWSTNSLSLLADALHSVVDSSGNIMGLFISRLAVPYPDREHPYGHQKFDAIGALAIASFLVLACVEIIQGAIDKLIKGGEKVEMSPPVLWLMLVVVGVNIFVTWYEHSIGKRVNSGILIADAQHTLGDIWITLVVIAGLFGVWLGYQWLDVLLAFPVTLLVAWSGWGVLRDNLPWLVDKIAIAPEAIHQIVMQVPGVVNCHEIASRGVVGRQVFIEMHLIVNAQDIATAHKITEEIEARLQEKYHPVRVLIHVEPPEYKSNHISYDPAEEN